MIRQTQSTKYRYYAACHMHIAAKICLALGALISIGGVILGVIGFSSLADIEEYKLKNVSNGEIILDDEDGAGEIGVTFWVKGNYVDVDDNGRWDHCESMNITVSERPPLVSKEKFFDESNYYWVTKLNGTFYYEVLESQRCDSEGGENRDNEKIEDGLIKLGRACYGCSSGVFKFNLVTYDSEGNITTDSNQTVWVSYDDEVAAEVGERILVGLGGGGLFCCGVVFLIIGMILVFTVKDNAYQPVMVQGPDGQMVMVHSNQPSEQAVMIQQPPQGGL